MKRAMAMTIAGFLFLFQGCVMFEGKLIREVFSSVEKPKRFETCPIDDIVKKYIPEGITRAKAKELLLAEGFKISEVDDKKPRADCVDCESAVLVARYDHKPFYNYAITVQIRFLDDNAVTVHGWYVTNIY